MDAHEIANTLFYLEYVLKAVQSSAEELDAHQKATLCQEAIQEIRRCIQQQNLQEYYAALQEGLGNEMARLEEFY
ncbi:MAG: hypothetical protein WCA07_11300 [Gloeobacterales cyanobacterium]